MMVKALIIALAIASCTIGQGTNNSIIDASDSQSVDKMKSDETKKSEQMVPKDVKTDNSGSKNQVGEDKQRQMTKEKEKPKDDGKQKNHNTPNIVNPKVIVLKNPKPTDETLFWGLVWWELLCIIVGSVLIFVFLCICCCALLEQPQTRQEVRGPNGEQLGFFQAPGRHLILVMDNRFSRNRGTNAATVASVPAQPTASPAQAATPASNPPHAPTVQPLYPKA